MPGKQLSEFESAFAAARFAHKSGKGPDTFEFKGKKYSVAVKGEGKSSTTQNPFGKGGAQGDFKTPTQRGEAKMAKRTASTPKPKDLAPGTGVSKSKQLPLIAVSETAQNRRALASRDVAPSPVPDYLKNPKKIEPPKTMGYKPGAATAKSRAKKQDDKKWPQGTLR